MPKPLTINFDTFKEMFQLENPDLCLEVDLGIEDHQIDLYHIILSGIKSSLAPHFDVQQSSVKNFKVYSGESAKLQSVAYIDFEVPSTEETQSPQRYLATLLYAFGPHPSDPKKKGIDVSFYMLGKIESSPEENGDLEIVPIEMKCRQIVGKNSNLTPVDVNFPNNVKGAVCYADAIFRCFLDGTDIDYREVQDWLNMDAFNEVNDRYNDLLQRSIGGLMQEITNDEDLDLSAFEGQVMLCEPALKQ